MLSSSFAEKSVEEQHIAKALGKNGYSSHLISDGRRSRRKVNDSTSEEPAASVTLPYILGVSETIQRAFVIYYLTLTS